MQMKNSKNGISIVVLVITVILIILLTATVMVNPVNPVTEVQIVTLQSSIKTIEEAVNLKVSDNMIKYANEKNRTLYKWVNVISGYTESMAAEGTQPTSVKTILGTIKVYNIDDAIQTTTNITKEELANYLIDEQGNVYYDEFEYEDEIYYAANIKKMEWAEEIEENNNLNEDTPCVTQIINDVGYVIPIPKGFVPSNIEGEKTVSEGFVIYDTEVSPTRNQFVWVPVDNTYKMKTALNVSINNKTALDYWKESQAGTGTEGSGYNEPYPRTNGSWTKTEWDLMYASVMKYGGFYMARYETGGSTSAPVVQPNAQTIRPIKWDVTNKIEDVPTQGAAYIARNMYASNNSDYGATSTLAYGIQWDSVMNWADCANHSRPTNTYTAKPSLTGAVYKDGVTYDVEKNIYDLAGNVCEWSMESYDNNQYVGFSGQCHDECPISDRGQAASTFTYTTLGFRIALYVE